MMKNNFLRPANLLVTILSYSYSYVRSGLKRLKIDDVQVTVKLLEVFLVFFCLFIELYNVYNKLVCVLK